MVVDVVLPGVPIDEPKPGVAVVEVPEGTPKPGRPAGCEGRAEPPP